MWVLRLMVLGALLKSVLGSSRIWPSTKTGIQCVDDYDSDLDDEGSGMGIPADTYRRSARCVGLITDSRPPTDFTPYSIPEDPLPTYKAPAPALVLKSGAAKT